MPAADVSNGWFALVARSGGLERVAYGLRVEPTEVDECAGEDAGEAPEDAGERR